ncbi:hypothetical protein CDAR_190681 [Caerostris darwini]|uniref:Uncharacterized protein n=1 Tax=Caerostris darwini TaxID=1538125 RepID=A0AAV4SCU5_9ARAC|nr:hypothetical protein CDAR_190681 [Caerostris darwini]
MGVGGVENLRSFPCFPEAKPVSIITSCQPQDVEDRFLDTMLNHLSAAAFQRFACHQDRGPIVRVISIQITYFLKSALGMAARWRGGLRIGHVEQVATDLLSEEIY